MPSEASLVGLKPAWRPGQSGNERGANRGYRRVLAIARKASPEAMEAAVKCMHDDGASWRERLAAIAMILDRAWGAPKQNLSIDGADGMNIVIVTGVPRPEADPGTLDGQVTYSIALEAPPEPPGGREP